MNLFGWWPFKTTNQRIADLEARLEESTDAMEDAADYIEKIQDQLDGLTNGYGLLHQQMQANVHNQNLTIACLLAWAGEDVFLSKDLMDVIAADEELVVKTDYLDTGARLRLMNRTDAEAEDAAAAEKECGNDCGCQQ